jgi:two-component system, response regulator
MTGQSILLIEDNPSDIGLTKRALKRARIANDLIVLEDGEAALDYLLGEPVRELPGLVLLDLKLPKVSGLDVLRRIRENERTKRLPVVILTTSTEQSDIGRGYDLGASSYVVKPVDFEQFAHAVEQLGLYWLVLNESPPCIRK